ncbi:MAG: TIGR02466 family protein [Rhodospirillales bacterium]|nr:TIGR02466 family protein [Rhodospirillales bacterium]
MIELEEIIPQPFFPTYAWVMDLKPAVYEPLNRQVAHDLNALTAPRPQIPRGRNWQTEQNLHEFEEFAELVKLFYSASEKVLDTLEIEYGGITITGCWANINPRGAFHIPHTHPNNFLSGIYYVQALPGADKVSFHEPRPQQEILSPRVKQENLYNATMQHLSVKPGRMVIFPSWLVHSVTTNASDQLRISISFNIMFSAFAETMSRPKWSGIPLRRK